MESLVRVSPRPLLDSPGMTGSHVYPLWHIHHVAADADGEIRHFSDPDDYWSSEEEGDDVKLLGVYSSRAAAERAIERARTRPGFRDEPRCFFVGDYVLDKDAWADGFVTLEW